MTWRMRPAHRYGPDEQCGAYARRAQCTPAFTLNTTTPNGELELSSRTRRLDVVVLRNNDISPYATFPHVEK